jgi:hypothetical protein
VQCHTRNCDAEISFKNYKRTLGKAADDFMHKWQMPNCLGALDGKHISIFAPQKSGSLYHNYKGNYSLVLMALVDANYKYLIIDVGAYGSNSDGGIFANCQFGKS